MRLSERTKQINDYLWDIRKGFLEIIVALNSSLLLISVDLALLGGVERT